MAGTIAADTLTHSTAGSIATNYVVNGSIKSWVSVNATGVPSVRGSFNVASVTDDGTGKTRLTTTASFSSSDDMAVSSGAANGVATSSQYLSSGWVKDSNEYWIGAVWSTTSYNVTYTFGTVAGDLA